MLEQLRRAREQIAPRLEAHLESYAGELQGVNRWGPDVCSRVAAYSTRGKMVRGALVLAGAKTFGADVNDPQVSESILDVAVVMELLQSFLLIHDDIMDNDDTRRGERSVHAQYREEAATWGVAHGASFGYSMGICAGDVTMLLAQRILAALPLDDERYRRLHRLVSQEIACVGVAQMDDLYFGHLTGTVPEDEVYRLYRYKTGRYTFSLPLAMGAIFAELPEAGVERLMRYGEELGVLFQVVDDDIGLFGETEVTGKPVGSDIGSDKKTLHRRFFMEAVGKTPNGPAAATAGYFGKSDLQRRHVEEVRRAMHESGVHARIGELLSRHAERARALAREIATTDIAADAAEEAHSFLDQLVDYNLNRRV